MKLLITTRADEHISDMTNITHPIMKDYAKWVKENEHLPKLQTAEEILDRPRPKSDPPRPPMGPTTTDEQLEKWGEEYAEWSKENNHLPNLQPSDTLVQRMKEQRDRQKTQQPPVGNAPGITPDLEARFQRIEQKMDKLIKHLGVR